MPGKSRHKRSKHSSRSKKRVGGLNAPLMAAQPVAIEPAHETMVRPQTPKISATATAVQYPYIFTELRRIGILSGIILAILIVISLILT